METKQDNKICRVAIKPSESEGYDFDAIAIPTENKQLRYSWANDEYYYEILRTGEGNINTERLASGLPIFDNHPEMEDAGAMNLLGITTDFTFLPEGLYVQCKLGARSDDALRTDIKNKLVKTVSIEGTIEKYLIERTAGELPIYYAENWTPYSLSFAPVPNDIGAQIEVKRAIEKQLKPEIKQVSFFNSLINKF